MKTNSAFSFAFLSAALFSAGLASCGGSSQPADNKVPGYGHGEDSMPAGEGGDDIDAPLGTELPDAGATEPEAPVTFVLTNTGKDDLFLNMDKGWQAVIFAYSGEPPNAKSMLMFPTHCTASCDSPPEEVCPYCPEPTRVKDIKAAEKHDAVAPGDSREVPWDMVAYSYKRTKGKQKGKRVRCKCYNTVEPEPETYTIRACGLRKTKTAKKSSKYQCAEAELTLPVEEPVRVELNFE